MFTDSPMRSSAFLWGSVCLFFLWVLFYYQALYGAVRLWYESEIFSHGFLVLPLTGFMLWAKRDTLNFANAKPALWALIPLALTLFLGQFGQISQINLLAHFSAFVFLPIAFLAIFGWQLTIQHWFPLVFILFAVPVGEQLIGHLQSITAGLAIFLLKLSKVPVYVEGLYIAIPGGKFVVAEACSGIRFFIASLVFSAVYGYFNFVSLSRRAIFIVLAMVISVAANAVRVYGTILVGYFFGMQYASGADHLVYGWVFFAIVILLLVFCGEWLRKGAAAITESQGYKHNEAQTDRDGRTKVRRMVFIIGLITTVALIWQLYLKKVEDNVASDSKLVVESIYRWAVDDFYDGWQPIMKGYDDVILAATPFDVDLAVFWYARDDENSELITSGNRLYDINQWSLDDAYHIDLSLKRNDLKRLPVLEIASVTGRQRVLLYWYSFNGRVETVPWRVKLYQSIDRLLGGNGAAALFVISTRYTMGGENEAKDRLLKAFVERSDEWMKVLPAD